LQALAATAVLASRRIERDNPLTADDYLERIETSVITPSVMVSTV